MGFESMFVVDKVSMSGGLAFMWREANMATLIGYSTNHIDMSISLPGER